MTAEASGAPTQVDLHPGNPRPEEPPLTIVQVVAPAAFGGLETVLRSLAAGLTERGHSVHVVTVVTPDATPHPFAVSLRSEGVEVHELVLSSRAYREERHSVAEICRRTGAELLHTHGYRPDVLDAGIASRLGIPRVSTVHGFCGGNLKDRLYEYLQIRSFRRFDAVVAVARPQVERLLAAGVSRDRIHLLPNGWTSGPRLAANEARSILGVGSDAFHVGWVGRLSHEKGADLFLQAVASLADIRMVASVIGAGPEEAALRTLASDLGISERIRWHGALPNAGQYFAAFDAYALSSRTEGTPMVLFEAMAAGTPIAATAVGGVPDVLTAADGWLVGAGDHAGLAEALRAVHDDRAAAARRAAAAERRLHDVFGAAPWLDRHERMYRRLVATHAR